jgi:hypothetical protein
MTMISQNDLIERWQNVPRVLDTMTEKERQSNWDMGTWGRITECGTVHCAAGRCGLDPWFRDRGFKMDFDKHGEAEITDVSEFFGYEGSWEIFLNSKQRPVEQVIEEVNAYLSFLNMAAALTIKLGTPALGEHWDEQGGIYAGIVRGQDGAEPYILIAGPEFDGRAHWNDAMKWATEINVNGFKDFSLPSRTEGRRLMDTVPQLFTKEIYWLREQHAADSGFAWGQGFNGGNQSYWDEDGKGRVRAFRRIKI